MSPFFVGFANELTKVAGSGHLLERLRNSPELRRAIASGALLGAGTGATTGALSKKNENEDRAGKILRNAVMGAFVGGGTGAAFPAWFVRENRLAPDEILRTRPSSSATRVLPAVGGLATLSNLAYQALT